MNSWNALGAGMGEKKSLMQISQEIESLMLKLDSLVMEGQEVPQELEDQLSDLVTKEAHKIDNCCSWVNEAKYKIEWLVEEKQKIDFAIKAYQRSILRVGEAARRVMERENTNKIEGMKGHSFSLRSSESVSVIDMNALPGEYTIIEAKPNKRKIKADIKEGKEVPGAILEKKLNVNIK